MCRLIALNEGTDDDSFSEEVRPFMLAMRALAVVHM